jgi:hypothetical protein
MVKPTKKYLSTATSSGEIEFFVDMEQSAFNS